MKPPVLLRLNHGQNNSQNESEYALVAKARENLRAETVAAVMRVATRARICFTNRSKMGVRCARSLATRLMMTSKGFCSTKSMGVGSDAKLLLKCINY